MYKRQINLQKP